MAVSFVLIEGKSHSTLVQFIYCIKLLNSTVPFLLQEDRVCATGGIGTPTRMLSRLKGDGGGYAAGQEGARRLLGSGRVRWAGHASCEACAPVRRMILSDFCWRNHTGATQKKTASGGKPREAARILVARSGIEPPTRGFSIVVTDCFY
jgi:hypothetical protein